jgi:uncharacterized membrane protein
MLIDISPFFIRIPSLFFSAITIVVIWKIIKKVLNPLAAIITASYFAINPFFVNNGFQAKTYGLTYLLTAISVYLSLPLISPSNHQVGKKRLFFFVVTSIATMYSDYSVCWIIIALTITVVANYTKISKESFSKLLTIILAWIIGYGFQFSILIKNLNASINYEQYLGKPSVSKIIDVFNRQTSYETVDFPFFILNVAILALISRQLHKSLILKSYPHKYFAQFALFVFYISLATSTAVSFWRPILNERNLWPMTFLFIYGLGYIFTQNQRLIHKIIVVIYLVYLCSLSYNQAGFDINLYPSLIESQLRNSSTTPKKIDLTPELMNILFKISTFLIGN